ncbi:MAG: 50S ribosomal protein L13 [Omnitrophica WOR_2 bacterium SM23_72]|nr:MAG: 50S ribosomal protein L13 [Omnitrophica WOR_2 bacterium SM23_72]
MTRTYIPKKEDIKRQWYLVDARGKILGRLASRIAVILRGKHKAQFCRHMDTGDYVIVINASKVKVTGRKPAQKIYRRFSGYPGGLREVPLESMLVKKPQMVVKLAVRRMLPGGPLGRDMFKKLKVYAGEEHLHQAQKPVSLKI